MALNSLAESNSQIQANDASSAPEGKRYLNCHLAPNMTVLLPIDHLTEVLTIPIQQVTPIPMMNPWVMGVHNWRGEVLWTIDLGHLLGLTPWYQQGRNVSSHNTLVIRNHDGGGRAEGELKLGLVVSQVLDIEAIPPEAMRASMPSGITSPELAPFFQGYTIAGQGHVQSCLDPEAIFSMIAK